MTYKEALDYLKTAAARGSILGLERISELMQLLGSPQDKVKIIHISGTNGKGSFAAMISSILCETGMRVGTFSSPAMTSVTESFRINCEEISEKRFAEIIGEIYPVCESVGNKPTEFEVLTAVAFQLFYEEGCDIAVIECGMGGDLDSTNVIASPLLSVITNVQIDHCGFLGDTTAEIASHKAGIIKKGRPVYFGGTDPDALVVISDTAKKQGSRLFLPKRDEFFCDEEKCRLGDTVVVHNSMEYHVSLSGSYQYDNIVNVLSCVDILRDIGVGISETAVEQGLKKVRWKGRFEVLCDDPLVIYDGSHNPDGIACAAESIKRYFPDKKVVMLIGVMADKDYSLYADMLGDMIHSVYTVKPDNPRSLDSDTLAGVFSEKGLTAKSSPVLADGVRLAFEESKRTGLPMIALGTLYMYREVTVVLNGLV